LVARQGVVQRNMVGEKRDGSTKTKKVEEHPGGGHWAQGGRGKFWGRWRSGGKLAVVTEGREEGLRCREVKGSQANLGNWKHVWRASGTGGDVKKKRR